MRVKPSRPDLVIRFPGNPRRVLKADGEEVPDSVYWNRRLLDAERGMDGVVRVPDAAPVRAGQPQPPVTPMTTR